MKKMDPATTTTTPSIELAPVPAPATTSISLTQCDANVIESLKKYNQSQIEKVRCIESDTSALDCDVVGGTKTTHANDDMPEVLPAATEPTAIAKTVVCFVVVTVTTNVYI